MHITHAFRWLLAAVAFCLTVAAGAQPGLTVSPDGVLLRGGKPYHGIGVNYFDIFARVLAKTDDTSYKAGLKALADRKIPFVRFMCGGFWPVENKLYMESRSEYFARLDAVVKEAERDGVGLIPSLFWNTNTVPDLCGEPMDQWGNAQSKTIAFMREYVREVVTRFAKSKAIWAWEFGNEYNLGADLPNASEHRPAVWPNLGTPSSRSERDDMTHDMIRTAFAEFAKEVRKYDETRPITSGNGFPRPSAWHQKAEKSWTQDTEAQYAEMLAGDTPSPMDLASVHLYPGDDKRFDRPVTAEELLKSSMDACRTAKRALFVGEFGAPQDKGADAARTSFAGLLDAIVKTGVPLAALWVYDYNGQDEVWNVTASNVRAYQLDLIVQANKKLAASK